MGVCVRNDWCVLGEYHDSEGRRAPESVLGVPPVDTDVLPRVAGDTINALLQVEAEMMGRKDDAEKQRWDLLPWKATADVVKVLTHGAAKYEPDNWRIIDGWRWRYHAAAVRHIAAWTMGERNDPEWDIHHLAHAICCLMFIIELDHPKET